MYAPYIGSIGIDIETKCTREEAWAKERHTRSDRIDAPVPWYPEMAGFKVCHIEVGRYIYLISLFVNQLSCISFYIVL